MGDAPAWLRVGIAVVAAGVAVAATAQAATTVKVVVLKEHGVGTSAAAQPYLTQFVGIAAGLNGWDPASDGKYFTSRADAESYIKSSSPQYGIFSLPAFLELRSTYNLDVVGEAKTNSGGEQYFIVSNTQSSLADCKGKKLATDHASTPSDQRFIDKVIAGGAFKVSDFTLVTTTRFGQAGTKLLNNDADCALIHEAQLADLQKSPGGGAVKTAWSSAKVPGMPVVAFPSAGAAEKASFGQSLSKLCQGNGTAVCSAVGVSSVQGSSNSTYQSVISSY